MFVKKTQKDTFSKNIEKITPSSVASKSEKSKNEFITETINGIKGEIDSKVCSLVELASQIQTGISRIGNSINDIDLKSFINSGVDAVKNKLNDTKKLIENTSKKISLNEKNISSEINQKIKSIDNDLKQSVESAKLASDGMIDTATNISNFSNKRLKDISKDINFKKDICNNELQKTILSMENSAKNQISNFNISNQMNQNLEKNSKLINENLLPNFE